MHAPVRDLIAAGFFLAIRRFYFCCFVIQSSNRPSHFQFPPPLFFAIFMQQSFLQRQISFYFKLAFQDIINPFILAFFSGNMYVNVDCVQLTPDYFLYAKTMFSFYVCLILFPKRNYFIMKQLVAIAPSTLSFLDYKDRALNNDEIYVKVLYASPKHGSEIVDFRGTTPFIKEKYDNEWQLLLPRKTGEAAGVAFGEWNVGNMIVGEITAKGKDVQDYEIGDRVCTYGGIRETHIVKAIGNHRLLKLPQNVSWQNALCYDPAQFALGGIRDGNVRPGDFVAVFGLGAIGQLAVQMAKHIGAMVIAIDPIKMRCDIAAKYGADFTINSMDSDTGLKIKEYTGKKGVDVIIETSGSKEALQHSLRGLAYGGTISYVAWAKEFGAGLDLGREAHYNNAKIVFSRVASEPSPDYPRWNRQRIEQTVWQMLTSGYLDGIHVIQPVVSFEDAVAAYSINVDQHPERSIKLGIEFKN